MTAKQPARLAGGGPVRVQLLGGFQVWVGGRAIPDAAWSRREMSALVKLLALAPHHRRLSEQVAGALWPESPASSDNLSRTVHLVRRVLEPDLRRVASSVYLQVKQRTLSLCPQTPITVDVEQFEKLATAARGSADPDVYAVAVAAYTGDLLPDDPYEDWLSERRDDLRRAYLGLLLDLGGLYERLGGYADAVATFRRLLRVERAHEEAHRGLMRGLARLGQRDEALRQYQQLATALRLDLGTEPDGATRALHDAILANRLEAGLPANHEQGAASRAALTVSRPVGAMGGSALAEPPPAAPTGTVTFLLTDVEGSAHLWERQPDAMAKALARSDGLLAELVGRHGGSVVERRGDGDGRVAVFAAAADAVACAGALQAALHRARFEVAGPYRLRLALHTGDAHLRGGGYVGAALNRCSRLRGAANGGQVLLSGATAALVRDRLPAGARLRDLGEHHLPGLGAPERLFELVVAGLAGDSPAPLMFDGWPGNLPSVATSLIDREEEIAAILALLADVRLLTLVGPGGVGKTRLALAVARESAGRGAGVAVVPLAPVTDPDLVPAAVAEALELRESGRQTLIDDLVERLKDGPSLLVLDNFEHVAAAAPLVATLLDRCAGLTVLTTSRSALQLETERLLEVAPLRVPGDEWSAEAETVRRVGAGAASPRSVPPEAVDELRFSPSVQLFVQRAQAAKAEFSLTAANARAVAEICRRLDGVPLALELAAARCRLMPPDAMLARLTAPGGQPLRLLANGPPDAPERQRSLHGAVDWSYRQLAPEQQALLRRLSVFSGGFTLEAAEAVAGEGGGSPDCLDSLSALIEGCLVTSGDADGEPRFTMLRTIREFGLDRLAAEGEAGAVRRRHAEHYLALAEATAAHLHDHGQGAALHRLDREQHNLRLALAWYEAAEDGDGDAAAVRFLRLAAALGPSWFLRFRPTEGRRWLAAALEATAGLPEEVGLAGLRARAFRGAGSLANLARDGAGSRAAHERSLALAERHGDAAGVAAALLGLGQALVRAGGSEAAGEARLAESVARFEALGDRWGAAVARFSLGTAAFVRGDHARAAEYLTASAETLRRAGDAWHAARSLELLGEVRAAQGRLDEATAHIEAGRRLHEALGDRWGIANALNGLGEVALARGDLATADALLAEGGRIFEAIGHAGGLAISLFNRGRVARGRRDWPSAADSFRACLRIIATRGPAHATGRCLFELADTAAQSADDVAAAVWLGALAELGEAGPARLAPGRADHYRGLADTLKGRLGEPAFEAAAARGRTTPLDELAERL